MVLRSTGVKIKDRFETGDLIGSGGMAHVWRARDLLLEREVAIKRPLGHLAADPGSLARFSRETRAAAGLSHPNIVTVFDAGEDEAGPWLAMELITGETLRQKLDRTGRLDQEEALAIVNQIAAAIDYAHSEGVVHRDLKPGNVLLGQRVMVADFGLARALDGGTTITTDQTVFGSLNYMAPEALRGQSGPASDIYGLAAVAYEMLTGVPPLRADSTAAVLDAIQNLAPQPPSSVVPLAVAFDQPILAALSKNPADRPDTAEEFAAALVAASGATLPFAVMPVEPKQMSDAPTTPIAVVAAEMEQVTEAPTTPIEVAAITANKPLRHPRRTMSIVIGLAAWVVLLMLAAAAFQADPPATTSNAALPSTAPAPSITSPPTTTIPSTTALVTTTVSPQASISALAAELRSVVDNSAPRYIKPKDARELIKKLDKSLSSYDDGEIEKAGQELEDFAESSIKAIKNQATDDRIVELSSAMAEAMGFRVVED